MDNKENLMIQRQARVKVNIYKTLLEEEKQKNKRNSTIGISLFIVGIVSTTALYRIKDSVITRSKEVNPSIVKTITEKNNFPKYLEGNSKTEMDLFNGQIISERELSNVKEEDFFVTDFKM